MLKINESHVTKDIVDDAKAVILIVPGLEKHLDKYDYVASMLNNYKYSVYRFNQVMTRKYYDTDYKEFNNHIEETINLIKNENEDKPIFILSSSNEDTISNVDGIIVYSYIKNYYNVECPTLILDVYENEISSRCKHNKLKVYREENQDYILTDINNWIRKRLRYIKNK